MGHDLVPPEYRMSRLCTNYWTRALHGLKAELLCYNEWRDAIGHDACLSSYGAVLRPVLLKIGSWEQVSATKIRS
jgi:hypothetical protein